MTRSIGNHGHGTMAKGGALPVAHDHKKRIATTKVRKHAIPHRRETTISKRMYVLDTNVLMHAPDAIYRFQEHDVFIPFQVLRELDGHKKGLEEVSRNVRQATRILSTISAGKTKGKVIQGIQLKGVTGAPLGVTPSGRLFLESKVSNGSWNSHDLDPAVPDDKILMACLALQKEFKGKRGKDAREVVLVSKDMNIRLRALMVGVAAEDYLSDTTVEDVDILHSGVHVLGKDFWDKQGSALGVTGDGRYRLREHSLGDVALNEILSVKDGKNPVDLLVQKIEGGIVHARTLVDHTKKDVWGITARNDEQNFALNLLMDPNVHFVSLLGPAGTGKTLLALAAGLEQVFEMQRYKEIIVTRATVPVGDEIGFLPGTETEKMSPWMGALTDNLEVLSEQRQPEGSKKVRAEPKHGKDEAWEDDTSLRYLMRKVKIRSLSFMRGRTFLNRLVIIDEAQNLTPKQMKTLITRAGPDTKIICLGNLKQIDHPYLNETSSGLGYAVERFRGWEHSAHITLLQIERSPLAEYAEQHL